MRECAHSAHRRKLVLSKRKVPCQASTACTGTPGSHDCWKAGCLLHESTASGQHPRDHQHRQTSMEYASAKAQYSVSVLFTQQGNLPCMAVLHQRLLSHPHQRWPLPGPPPSRLHPPRMAALHQLPCRVTRILACPCATVCSHPWRCNIIHMQLWVMHLSRVQHLQ